MAFSVFDDKSRKPTGADLAATLGRSIAQWRDLVSHLESEYPPLDATWGFAGAKWGWSLRLKQKKRTVLYMTPRSKHFLVGFALGEKAVKAATARPLPDTVLAIIDRAPRYAEGRGIRLEVRTRRDLDAVKALASAKMAT